MVNITGQEINPEETTDFEKEYLKNQAIKNRYENSPSVLKGEEDQQQTEELGKLVEADAQSKEDNTTGLFGYAAGFVKHLGIGAVKGVEEAGQTFGMLDDNAWDLPEPKNIVESFGQGIGQFLPGFGVGGVAIRGGLKVANLLQKGGKLSNAGRNLTALGAGAFSDVIAFDPKDQNMGNLALSIGAVSQSPRASAFVKEYLAQDDADSEAKARMKNALTGMVAGAITEGLIRGAGYSYRKGKARKRLSRFKKYKGSKKEGDPEVKPEVEETQPVEYTPQDEFGSAPQTRGGTRGSKPEVDTVDEQLAGASGQTAIKRSGVSVPTRKIKEVKGRTLHHGAGRVDNPDRAYLDEISGDKEVVHHDPVHSPEEGALGQGDFDDAVSNYVLNVLPSTQRKEAIQDLADSLKETGEAKITVRGQGDVPPNTATPKNDNWKQHDDGWIVKNKGKENFQKGYTPEELKAELLEYFDEVEVTGTAKGKNITATVRKPKKDFEHEAQDEFGASPLELKEATAVGKEAAETFADEVDKIKASGGATKLGDDLPNGESAAVHDLNTNYVSDVWAKLKAEDSKFTEQILARITDFASGKGLPIQEMTVDKVMPDGSVKQIPLLESINFLKLDTEAEMQNALQFFAKAFDIKQLAKPGTKNQDLETVLNDLLDPIYGDDAAAMDQVIEAIGQKAANVDEAIRYVGSAKLLHRISIDRMNKQSLKFSKTGEQKDYDLLEEIVKRDEMLHRASGLLSFKSGQLLRAHQKKVSPLKDKELLESELVKDVVKSTGKIVKRGHRNHKKLLEQDQHRIKEIREEGKLSEEVELTGADKGGKTAKYSTKRRATVTAGETPSGKPRAKRINKAKETIKTITERVRAKVASLKKQAKLEKSPSRGHQRPKEHEIMGDPEISHWTTEIKKIRAERATTDSKFSKTDQAKSRAEYDKWNSKLRALEEGGVPLKEKTGQAHTTAEIKKLKLQYRKKLKEIQKKLDSGERHQNKIDGLNEKLMSLISKRLEKTAELDPHAFTQPEKHPQVKELEKLIKNEETALKERVTRKELEETLIAKTRAGILEDVNKMDLRQLRTRVASLKKTMLTKTTDGMLEIYINGLLSGFKTFGVVNPLGNTSAFVSTVIERAFAGAMGDQIAMRESVELAWNFISGMPEAWKVFLSAMKSGTSDWNVKFDLTNPNERMISKEAFNTGGSLGKVIDFMGTVVNMPGKILISQDEAFKGLIIRGEQRALAWRKARNKFSSEDIRSPEIKAKIQQEFDDIVSDFSKHEDIVEAARETAAKNSFTNDLSDKLQVDGRTGKTKPVPGLSKSVQHTLDRHKFLKVFIPFFRTPVNILNFTWERTPIIQFANKNLRNELTSDNKAIKQLAMARVGTSMAITTAMFGMAMSGNFTGAPPRDRRLRKNMEIAMGGQHWYSFNMGGKWHSYDRYDPYGILMASSAAMATMGKSMIDLKGQMDDTGDPTGELEEKYNQVINSTLVGTAEMIKDRHYIQGISEFISFLSGDNRGLTPSIKRIATALDPRISFYSSLRRSATRGMRVDKPRKLQRGVGVTGEQDILSGLVEEINLAHTEAMRDVVPGYGNIEPEKDLVGNVVAYPGTDGEFDTIHNLFSTTVNPSPGLIASKSPLIQKLAELESNIEQPSSIKKMGNVVLAEEEKTFIIDKWTQLNRQIVEPILKTAMFRNAGAGLQKLIIETLIRKNKDASKKLALAKFERLRTGFIDYKINDTKRKVTEKPTQGFQPPSLFNARQ